MNTDLNRQEVEICARSAAERDVSQLDSQSHDVIKYSSHRNIDFSLLESTVSITSSKVRFPFDIMNLNLWSVQGVLSNTVIG